MSHSLSSRPMTDLVGLKFSGRLARLVGHTYTNVLAPLWKSFKDLRPAAGMNSESGKSWCSISLDRRCGQFLEQADAALSSLKMLFLDEAATPCLVWARPSEVNSAVAEIERFLASPRHGEEEGHLRCVRRVSAPAPTLSSIDVRHHRSAVKGAAAMVKKQSGKSKRNVPKTVLRLPDLDQAKSAVLNSFSSVDAQRGYRHAIEEFVEWYCSEPRLSFSKTVVLRYRIHLESRHLAPGTINLRLGAVRRLAYEASDCGLLSPDLAAGIRRVKGVKKIGVRLGNWLTPEQSRAALERA